MDKFDTRVPNSENLKMLRFLILVGLIVVCNGQYSQDVQDLFNFLLKNMYAQLNKSAIALDTMARSLDAPVNGTNLPGPRTNSTELQELIKERLFGILGQGNGNDQTDFVRRTV